MGVEKGVANPIDLGVDPQYFAGTLDITTRKAAMDLFQHGTKDDRHFNELIRVRPRQPLSPSLQPMRGSHHEIPYPLEISDEFQACEELSRLVLLQPV